MLKIAIVGMGIRGKMYANAVEKDGRAAVVSVCDVNRDTLGAYNKNGICTYGDYNKMFDEQRPDAIIVSTPDFAHKEVVVSAAERGIDILAEKPLATCSVDALAIRDAVKSSGIKFMIGFENRWNMPFVNVKRTVESGAIGKIVTMNSRLNDTIYVPTKMIGWASRTTPAWFLLSHAIDLGCWLNNRKAVKAYGAGVKEKLVNAGIDTYDSILATVTFDDGSAATFTASWILPESMPMVYDFKYEIIGTQGALYVDLNDQMVRMGSDTYVHNNVMGTPVAGRLTSSPELMAFEFIDNLINDEMPSCGIEDAYNNFLIVDAINKSIQSGEPSEISRTE